jgi:hypothetical protein
MGLDTALVDPLHILNLFIPECSAQHLMPGAKYYISCTSTQRLLGLNNIQCVS